MSDFRGQRRLGFKLGLNLAVVGLTGFVLILIFVTAVISTRFETLENDEMEQHVARTQGMLSAMQDTMQGKSLDWGEWTASYDFMNDWNQKYYDENLNFDAMFTYDIHALSLVRFDGSKSFSAYYDFDEGEEAPLLSKQLSAFVTDSANIKRAQEVSDFQAFARIGDRLLVVSFAQVLKSDASGTPRGFLVFGRELENEIMFEALQVEASYDFSADNNLPQIVKSSQEVAIAVVAKGVTGEPLATIRFSIQRKLKKTGRSLLAIIGVGIAALILAMIGLLNRRLKFVVTSPLSAMETHVSKISQSGELIEMVVAGRKDEIGSLASGFNEMAKQLNALRSKLEFQSFELGKTQNSIDVMHNVRNGLSPLGAILSRLNEDLHLTSQNNVSKALRELAMPDLPTARQQKLVAFVAAALEHYEDQVGNSRNLVREADRNLTAVVETIKQNQRDSDKLPELETIEIASFLSSSLSSSQISTSDSVNFEIDAEEQYYFEGNRILLTQIVNNILVNARESIAVAIRVTGKIKVDTKLVVGDEANMLCVSISDNGEGFDPSMTNRLFERGFSTRSNKTGGTGLHWSANTLRAMGGLLTIESEGQNLGAKVEIRLPLSEKIAKSYSKTELNMAEKIDVSNV